MDLEDEKHLTEGCHRDEKSLKKFRKRKKNKIIRACQSRDINKLVELATSSGGFLNDELRRTAWPFLLGCDTPAQSSPSPNGALNWSNLPKHNDEDQVQLDVNRAFVHYPTCPERKLDDMKGELFHLITAVLRKDPILSYFQGYHDIAQVFLLVLGPVAAEHALERISLFRIRDYMLPSLSPALKHLRLLPAILDSADPNLSVHISGARPFFALAATLTLYAHDVQEYGDIVRLYDFILSREPVVSIYLFAAIVLSRRSELFDIDADEPEMIHFTLTKLPQPLDLEPLISDTMSLYRKNPPESLPHGAWRKISAHSVLKSSRTLAVDSRREDAERLFQKQTKELRWEERRQKFGVLMRKHSHSMKSVGLAVCVGLVSYWILKADTSSSSVWRLRRLLQSGKEVFFSIT